MKDKFLPKSQGSRDLLLLAALVIPLSIGGVIWGIVGDFSEPREPVTPAPVATPATPSATPMNFTIVENV